MKWVLKEMRPSDMVRVPSGMFYHYGICIDENTVAQFGDSTVNLVADPNTVEVNLADIGDFLKGRFAEVAEYDKKELKRKRTTEQIIDYAKSCVGRKGYHILYNNCEHFVNECVFGESKSTQVDNFRTVFTKNFPMIDVYVAKTSRFERFKNVPDFAEVELVRLTNKELAGQKRCAYGLLEYAFKNSFNGSFNMESVYKDERGKPHSKDCFFSISHTNGLVCVAISKSNVGVDIEKNKAHVALDPLKTHMLCGFEKIESTEQALSLWTKKEAIYKLDDKIEKFIPGKINTADYQTKTIKISFENNEFFVSVAADSVANVNFLLLDGTKVN